MPITLGLKCRIGTTPDGDIDIDLASLASGTSEIKLEKEIPVGSLKGIIASLDEGKTEGKLMDQLAQLPEAVRKQVDTVMNAPIVLEALRVAKDQEPTFKARVELATPDDLDGLNLGNLFSIRAVRIEKK